MLQKLFPNLFGSPEELIEIDRQRQTKERIGAISDYEKIAILKEKLYVAARNGLPTIELRRAIDCLQNGLDAEIREKNSFNSQINSFVNAVVLSAIITTGLSYLMSFNCGNSSSQLCKDARLVPDAIARYIK